MQYSQLVSGSSGQKFSSDSTFFIHYENSKLYIKQSSVNLKNLGIINSPSTISQAQISPDSKYISILMGKKATIHIYRVQDCVLASKIEDPQAGISSYFWTADSVQILVFSEFMYKVSIYNLAERSLTYLKNPKLSTTKGFSFSHNSKFMALLQKHDSKDYLSIYYTNGWKMVNSFQLQLFDACEVRWSYNDGLIAVWDNCINYKMLIYCHSRGLIFRYQPYNFALGIKSVQFSQNSLLFAIGSFDQKIRLLNALTWQQISILDCSNPLINSQKIVVYRQQDGKNYSQMKRVQAKQFKINTMKVTNSVEKGTPNQGIGLLQFNQDAYYLACRNDNMPYTVWIWDVSKLQPICIISCNSQIRSLKWVKKQNMLSIIYGTDRILFWRTDNTIAECLFNFQNKSLSIQKMKWSKDTTKMLIGDKSDFAYAELLADSMV